MFWIQKGNNILFLLNEGKHVMQLISQETRMYLHDLKYMLDYSYVIPGPGLY